MVQRMPDSTTTKIDPIRDRYYAPLQAAEGWSDWLFYTAAALSVVVLLVDRTTHPEWYSVVQGAFVVITVLAFFLGLTIRLYLTPRAHDARLADFLSNAFSVPLTYERTRGYYNNEEDDPFRKIGIQVMENTWFTQELLRMMCHRERAAVAVWFVTWLVAVLNRTTPIDLIVACSLVLFSEVLLSRFLRLEWFRRRVENGHASLYRLFQSKPSESPAFAAAVVEALVIYENAKSSSGVTVSSKLFDKNNQRLSGEWDKIRASLDL
jgi:hypothetical protein